MMNLLIQGFVLVYGLACGEMVRDELGCVLKEEG